MLVDKLNSFVNDFAIRALRDKSLRHGRNLDQDITKLEKQCQSLASSPPIVLPPAVKTPTDHHGELEALRDLIALVTNLATDIHNHSLELDSDYESGSHNPAETYEILERIIAKVQSQHIDPMLAIIKEEIESFARKEVKHVPKVLGDLLAAAGYTVGYDATEHDLGLEGHVECPYRNDVEAYTIKQIIKEEGGLKGKNLIDFGSGGGVYARYAVDNGASSVLGVDIDVGFVMKAIKDNQGYEDTISYWIGDIQNYQGNEDKDMAIGSYIFSYPKTKEEAANYARAVASSLKPGGVFIGFNDSPFDIYQGQKYQQFGFTRELESTDEGSKVIYKFDEISDPIINYHLKPETYEEAFREAGLSLEWREVQLDTRSKKDSAYWDTFFTSHGEYPKSPFVAMVARKIEG